MKRLFTVGTAFALTVLLATGNMRAADGVDSPEEATLTILSSIPENNASIPGLFDEEFISVTVAQTEEYPDLYLEYEIEGKQSGTWEIVKASIWMNRYEDTNEYYQTIAGNYPMYEGVEYRIKINAWASEDDTHNADPMSNRLCYGYINLKGTTEMYQNSPYRLVSISPEDSGDDPYATQGLLSDDTPYLTITFDGPVNLGDSESTGILIGMGAGNMPFSSVKAVGESETVNGREYAKVWNLVFPEGYIAMQTTPLIVSVHATDPEGRVVKGTEGEFAGSYSLFFYNVPGMYGDIEFDFGADPIESVKEIMAYFDESEYMKGISYSYLVPMNEAKVLLNGTEVASVADIRQIFAPGEETIPDAVAIGARIILDKTVDQPGVYTFSIPNGYFNLGTQFFVKYQKAAEVEFTIPGGSAEPELPATFDPAPGSTMDALPESIFFNFGQEYICYGEYSHTFATISKDSGDPVELPEMEYSYEWPKGQGYQELGDFAGCKEEGMYTITFPYDYFRLGHWSADVDATTTPVEEMSITYKVGNYTGVEVVSIKSDRYRVYNTNGVMVLDTTNAADLKTLKGLYIVNGIKIVLK